MTYHWRCSCGAHSRDGEMTAYLAESLAMRHRLNQPIADDDPPGQRTFIGYPPPDQVGLRQAHQTEVYEEA